MEIEFDPDKASSNISKHGVSLETAENLEWDMLLAEEDKSVPRPGYIGEFSITVVFRNKAQYAGNGRSPCQVL